MTAKPEVLQMGPMTARVEAALDDAYTVHRLWEADDRDALLAEIGPRIRAVATDGHRGCPAPVFDRLPAVEILSSYGVGYDAIDIPACKARNVRVTNTPDVLNEAMAEITVGLMIALCRRLPQADAFVRAGNWPKGGFPLTGELTGARAGIIGLGRIGKEIARRLEAFRMRIAYHGRREQDYQPYEYFADPVALADWADWLIVIAPGGPETDGIVSAEVMRALGPEGNLVNVARGSLVDQAAMVSLLGSGELGGAALDVFDDEPNVPAALFAMDNVVLSPHQGSATTKTRAAMGDLVIRNLAAHFAGDPLVTAVA